MTTEHIKLPEGLALSHITNIHLDQSRQVAHISFRAHVGETRYPIDATEVLAFANDPELRGLAIEVERLVADRLKDPPSTPKEYKCDSCNANCCTKYEFIPVYNTDVPNLLKAVNVETEDELRRLGVINGTPSMGQAGWLGRIYLQNQTARDLLGAKHTCVFLTWDSKGVGRCGIYEHRPSTCRDYKERSCDMQGQAEPALYRIRRNAKYVGVNKIWKGEVFSPTELLNKYPHKAMEHEGA